MSQEVGKPYLQYCSEIWPSSVVPCGRTPHTNNGKPWRPQDLHRQGCLSRGRRFLQGCTSRVPFLRQCLHRRRSRDTTPISHDREAEAAAGAAKAGEGCGEAAVAVVGAEAATAAGAAEAAAGGEEATPRMHPTTAPRCPNRPMPSRTGSSRRTFPGHPRWSNNWIEGSS